ncbi:hypothetical protein CA51_09900 [Rosistilla oblonga]|uniref:Uncharacterized protein n=1 Tax=Rosistilla oblonga TaxID=2527990 RepID=A0A518IPM8_9BACT|nr:hypothetical protein [Rosistilla oblonga]QDV11130.1 hypothetical protein CA51_09900 [Rosistilla oblonga]QDV55049.1 hypothetical protein Mal33_10170 [Rosistilla oblonga]
MHLFTCPCGESFPISAAQAGQSIQCPHCNQSVQLPKLRDLKQLPVTQAAEEASPSRGWSAPQGVLFSVIFACLVASLGMSAWSSYRWLQIEKPPTPEAMIAMGQEEIENHSAAQLLEFWVNYGQPGMGTRRMPGYAQVDAYRESWKHWAFGAYAATAVSLCGLIFVVTKRSSGR